MTPKEANELASKRKKEMFDNKQYQHVLNRIKKAAENGEFFICINEHRFLLPFHPKNPVNDDVIKRLRQDGYNVYSYNRHDQIEWK